MIYRVCRWLNRIAMTDVYVALIDFFSGPSLLLYTLYDGLDNPANTRRRPIVGLTLALRLRR